MPFNTVGNFTVNVNGTSNSPGDPSGPSGDITNIETTVLNNSSSSDRLTIGIFSDGFTIPGAGAAYLNSTIASTSQYRPGALAYMSYVQQGRPHCRRAIKPLHRPQATTEAAHSLGMRPHTTSRVTSS